MWKTPRLMETGCLSKHSTVDQQRPEESWQNVKASKLNALGKAFQSPGVNPIKNLEVDFKTTHTQSQSNLEVTSNKY